MESLTGKGSSGADDPFYVIQMISGTYSNDETGAANDETAHTNDETGTANDETAHPNDEIARLNDETNT
ncbi:hypothetical protein [Bhargavaea massiliensis]|uniref:hypothetical protein n=1 Tax=Bhargavaea massiliensis TaxID=2697500 RepID=UPI001BCD3842|nr:hypothetical protein [Bhargavaea massiliensis]